jgi:lipooligosaccharide transport system ATP-binding protein
MEHLALKAVQVIKKYSDQTLAVDHLDFEIRPADCFGLLGPNGAGKSSMLKMIHGKADRTGGSISIFGMDPERDSLKIKSICGIVSQDDNLDEELSVLQNLLVYARFYGIPVKIAKEKIRSILEFMELTEKTHSSIRSLSGGMKRRLVIGRALLHDPKILILDEPTTGLDPQIRHLIWDKVRQLKNNGVTVILTTHYMEEAFQLCDTLIMMHKGKKVLEGNPHKLIAEHIEKYVLEIFNQEKGSCDLNGAESGLTSIRKEILDNRIYYYSNRLDELEKISSCLKTGEFYLRQSNLEDVFLKITGRKLDE